MYVVMGKNRSIGSGQSDMTSRSSIKCNLAVVGKVFAVHSALAFRTLRNAGPTKHQIPKQHCKNLQKVKH